jgi:hypothetical protein
VSTLLGIDLPSLITLLTTDTTPPHSLTKILSSDEINSDSDSDSEEEPPIKPPSRIRATTGVAPRRFRGFRGGTGMWSFCECFLFIICNFAGTFLPLETTTQIRQKAQRDHLAQLLYDILFQHIVHFINRQETEDIELVTDIIIANSIAACQ